MLIKKIANQKEIVAGDGCILRELLNKEHGDKVECRYSIAHAKVLPGEKTDKHIMKTTEVYWIIKGKGKMYIDEEMEEVGEYDTIYIPPSAVQYIENVGDIDLEFLCIVDPAWQVEDEIIVK